MAIGMNYGIMATFLAIQKLRARYLFLSLRIFFLLLQILRGLEHVVG